MANHKSAAKRARQNVNKRARNLATKKTVRTFEKSLREAIAGKDKPAAEKALVAYCSKLDKAASKGIVARNTASRKTARLSKQVSAI
ncbi:MAG: 30S ribosomal protein S20 [Bdellovibrionales bacterium]